jgi:hypothetical protein
MSITNYLQVTSFLVIFKIHKLPDSPSTSKTTSLGVVVAVEQQEPKSIPLGLQGGGFAGRWGVWEFMNFKNY